MTSAYTFASAQRLQNVSAGNRGNVYSRFTNPRCKPSKAAWRRSNKPKMRWRSLPGWARSPRCAMGSCSRGDNIVCSRDVFGTTASAFSVYMARFGIEARFVDLTDLGQWQQAIDDKTRLVVLESPPIRC